MLKSQFETGHNFLFSGKDHGLYIAHGILSKTGQNRSSSERPLSKLSENHKINVIGPTELKLWPFKDKNHYLYNHQWGGQTPLPLQSSAGVKHHYLYNHQWGGQTPLPLQSSVGGSNTTTSTIISEGVKHHYLYNHQWGGQTPLPLQSSVGPITRNRPECGSRTHNHNYCSQRPTLMYTPLLTRLWLQHGVGQTQ